MAELMFETVGFVQGVPEVQNVTGEFGEELKRWQAKVTPGAGETWGTLVEVADPKAAEVLRAQVGKRVHVKGRILALPKRAGGAWFKVMASSVEPA